MKHFLLESLVLTLALTPLVIVAGFFVRRPRWRWLALFLGLFAIEQALMPMPAVLRWHPPSIQWDWIGKLVSLGLAIAAIATLRLSRREVGLVLRQRKGSLVPAVLLTLVLVAVGAMVGENPGADAETIAYQATMPGLSEELMFRGVLLALIVRALEDPVRPGGAGLQALLGWGVIITSVAFGLVHALGLTQNGAIMFSPPSMLLITAAGFVYAWLRVRTGSLLFPILAHDASNVASLFT